MSGLRVQIQSIIEEDWEELAEQCDIDIANCEIEEDLSDEDYDTIYQYVENALV